VDITPYLYIPFVTWAIAQAIKFTLALIRGDVDFKYLYASGGMPSVHSAVVTSLATWALIAGGPSNPFFGFAAVFAAIVMYDSFGVRRSAGEQARTLNKLISDLARNGGLKNADDYNELREILGHKPLEVIIGSILGFTIACMFGYQKIAPYFNVFNYDLNGMQAKAVMLGALVFIVIAVAVYLLIRRTIMNNIKARKYNLYLLGASVGAAILAAGLAFLYYENVVFMYGLLGFVFIKLLWLAAVIFCIYNLYKSIKAGKKSVDEHRRDTWLKKAGKKK
jgi:acid phosphatase family membrane protein YuiD